MDLSEYSCVAFIDSMVVLQGQPLPQQPWQEIDSKGPILVAVVPQVQREIDKRKLDARLSKRSRLFNALCRQCFESGGRPTIISEGCPRVDIALVQPLRIDWSNLDLDPTEPDHVIVAQILHTAGLPADKTYVISHDGNTLAAASRHGIKVKVLSEKWLLSPEPNPLERKVRDLEQILKKYEDSQAKLAVNVRVNAETPLIFLDVMRPEWGYLDHYKDRLQHLNPDTVNDAMPPLYRRSRNREPSFAYNKYLIEELLPHATNIHRRLAKMQNQRSFSIEIENIGSVAALDMVLEIHAEGCTIHSKYVTFSAMGPKFRPAARSFADSLPSLYPTASVSRHDVYFEIEALDNNYAEAHCGDYRQGWKWSFSGVLTVQNVDRYEIKARLTARNMAGDITSVAMANVSRVQVEVDSLIDLRNCKFLREHPLEQEIQTLINEKKYSAILINPDNYDNDIN